MLLKTLQVILNQKQDCIFRRCEHGDIISVIEINLRTLPEHYSDYFYESLLEELPEGFIVAEIAGKIIGYIMCKMEYGFSNFKKLGFVKKGHVVSIAVAEEYSETAISIPIYPDLKKKEQIKIINYIKLFFKKYA